MAPHSASAGEVTVRFWAAAKEAAGCAQERCTAATVGEALTTVRARHAESPRFIAVLGQCSLLVDGEPVGGRDPEAVPLADGATIDVLPPVAGG